MSDSKISPSAVSSTSHEDAPNNSHSIASDTTGSHESISPQDTKEVEGSNRDVASPVIARVTTNRSSIVPRGKRRGMLGQVTLVPEIEDPKEYSRLTKHLITIVVAAGGAAAPMASAIVFPALSQISKDLHSSQTITNLSVALYMLSMAIFPLWWSSISERKGRRTVYITSFSLFVIFNICSAVSVNIGMLVFFRVASGGAASSSQSVGAGTIADIWDVRERGRAMGWFYLGPLCGPLFAPIIGGALTARFGWRSTQWFLAIFGFCVLLFMTFCLPETFRGLPKPKVQVPAPALDEKTAEETPATNANNLERTLSRVSLHTVKKAKEWTTQAKAIFIHPLKTLKFLKYPPVLLTVYYASIAFCCLYILNVSIQTSFSKAPYNYSTIIVGLLYIPGSLGYILASIVGGRWNDHIMKRAAMKRKQRAVENSEAAEDGPLEYRPEDRMGINAWIAGILFPCALLWYGWVVQNGVMWVGAMFATFTFGFGSMLIFSMATTMLTEFVPGRSSSMVAVNNFMRNIFSCIGGVVAEPIINSIGNGWLFTIMGCLGLLSMSVLWVMHQYGPRWRGRIDEYV
ncbi:hypothetical protein RUND412_005735 [Rhizina undulata]